MIHNKKNSFNIVNCFGECNFCFDAYIRQTLKSQIEKKNILHSADCHGKVIFYPKFFLYRKSKDQDQDPIFF
jgi:hypothetical protein